MEADKYQSGANALQSLGDDWEVITPSANPLAKKYRYILNPTAAGGLVTCETPGGTSTQIYVNAGDVLRVRPTKITASAVTVIGVL
jgi:hypothetical protein